MRQQCGGPAVYLFIRRRSVYVTDDVAVNLDLAVAAAARNKICHPNDSFSNGTLICPFQSGSMISG